MKRIFASIAFLLVAQILFAQGIVFEHGTWDEVLAKAQKENKPIFMDVYTSWCGPCKKMANEIFPQAEVGNIYNTSYINYKIDAEKGEGIDIAKKYAVSAYPTLIYLNPDGEMLYKQVGTMNVKESVAIAQKVLNDRQKHKPMAVWEKEYAANSTNPAFLLNYLTVRSELKMNNTELLEQYFTLTGEDASQVTQKVNMITNNARNLTLDSKAFAYLLQHKDSVTQKGMYVYTVDRATENTRSKAFKNKDEKLMAQTLAFNTVKSPSYPRRTAEEEWISFYGHTNQSDKLKTLLISFMEQTFLPTYKEVSQAKTEQDVMNKETPLGAQKNILQSKAQQIILMVIKDSVDKKLLKKGIEWQQQLLTYVPTNVTSMSHLASLYYKAGDKKKALSTQEEAIAKSKDEKTKTRLTEKYNHMKAGDLDDKMLYM